MKAGVNLKGLEEFRQALRSLPTELQGEAVEIVNETAEMVSESVKRAYPHGETGNLRKGVRVRRHQSQVAGGGGVALAIVTSNAPHSHLYEFGSEMRYHANGKSVGRMPAQPTMIPIAIRARSNMQARLMRLIERAGFKVSGG